MNFDNSQFEIKGNVERRSVEVYSFYNDILSAELSIQHPISKQSKAYIRGGEFGDSAFLLCLDNVITTRIVESQMLNNLLRMTNNVREQIERPQRDADPVKVKKTIPVSKPIPKEKQLLTEKKGGKQ